MHSCIFFTVMSHVSVLQLLDRFFKDLSDEDIGVNMD